MEQMMKVDPALAATVAKYAGIATVAAYINKVAELSGEEPLTDEQIVEVSVRAGNQLPDSIATTMNDPGVIAGIIQKLTDAANDLAKASPKTPSVTPEDVGLENIGQGQVLRQIAGNPHVNTGGIEINNDVKVIETQLMSGKKAALGLQNIFYGDGTMITENEIRAKFAAYDAAISSLISALSKLADADIPAVVAEDQKNAPTKKPASITQEAPAKTDDKTEDIDIIGSSSAGADVSDMENHGAPKKNPNPDAGKIARQNSLLSIIKKYKAAN